MKKKKQDTPVTDWINLYKTGMSFNAIAEMYKVSYKVVRSHTISVGLEPRKNKVEFTPEQIKDIIFKYTNSVSALKLSKEYDVALGTIRSLIKSNGIEWNNNPTDYKLRSGSAINRDCFNNFDTEEELYYFGLLLADGCIVSNTNRIQLSFKLSDSSILERFKKWLRATNEVRYYDKYNKVVFSFSDKIVADKLRSAGLESAKSLNEKPPAFYDPDNLNMRHFWRGFLDGDGFVHSDKKRKSDQIGTSRQLGLIGTEEMLNSFQDFCEKFAGVPKQNLLKHRRVDSNCYQFSYSGKRASVAANLFYTEASVVMDRKMQQASKLIENMNFEHVPDTLKNLHKVRKDSKTGIQGVIRGKETIIASFTYNKKRRSKSFNVNKYGEAEAFRLACAWRKSMEEKHYN
jgi:AP2 domain